MTKKRIKRKPLPKRILIDSNTLERWHEMTEQRNNAIEVKPPFSKPVTEFLQAIWAYFKYCIKPQPTYGNKKLQKPNWYVAFNQIERLPVKENETCFDIRERDFAEIAMANVKLKSLKREYKFAIKWGKTKLKKDIKVKFKELIG